jgi:hypothetical protein
MSSPGIVRPPLARVRRRRGDLGFRQNDLMSTITSDTVYAVAAELGFLVERFETTRAGDADSLGNGNWLVWQGEHTYVLRRYHVLRTEEDLAYESDILGVSCQGQLAWTAVDVCAW